MTIYDNLFRKVKSHYTFLERQHDGAYEKSKKPGHSDVDKMHYCTMVNTYANAKKHLELMFPELKESEIEEKVKEA